MKGNFDAYVLWPLSKILQNGIVDQSTASKFTVIINFKYFIEAFNMIFFQKDNIKLRLLVFNIIRCKLNNFENWMLPFYFLLTWKKAGNLNLNLKYLDFVDISCLFIPYCIVIINQHSFTLWSYYIYQYLNIFKIITYY